MDNWVVKMVRGRCLRQILAWALVFGCMVFSAVSEHRYIRNFLFGPFPMGQAELDAIVDVATSSRYFVRVTGEKAVKTGIQSVKVRKKGGVETDRTVEATYYALVVGQKLLIAKSAAESPATVEGALEPLPPSLEGKLFSDPKAQELRSRFYSFYLDDKPFRNSGYWNLFAALLIASFFYLFGVKAWRQWRDPSSHPAVARLKEWGEPGEVAAEVAEAARSPMFEGGGWRITGKYFIKKKFFTFDLLRLTDLLWAYKAVTKKQFLLFIPAGKTFTAVLTCYGGSAEVPGAEWDVDKIMAFATEKAPWAVFGYSPEVEAAFTRDPGKFCAAIEARRSGSGTGWLK